MVPSPISTTAGTDIPANLSSSTPASGTNYNISFGLDALALSNDADFTYFSNAPSATVMTPVGGSASLSATGAFSFIDALSFTYSASSAFTIKVLDAANNVLQTVSLAATNDSCTDVAFCVWTQASLSFSGAAKSFDFGDATYVAGFDNITVNEVPLPAAGWLLASGLALFRRRKPAVA